MKRLSYLLLICCLLMAQGCTSQNFFTNTSSLFSSSSDDFDSSENIHTEPRVYSNSTLGFAFTIPDIWPDEDYKIIVSHGKQKEDHSPYSQIDFIFRNDTENPLLRILVVNTEWWAECGFAEDGSALYNYLGKQESFTYCYTCADTRNYADESTTEEYNAMVPSEEIVKKAFQLIDIQPDL